MRCGKLREVIVFGKEEAAEKGPGKALEGNVGECSQLIVLVI